MRGRVRSKQPGSSLPIIRSGEGEIENQDVTKFQQTFDASFAIVDIVRVDSRVISPFSPRSAAAAPLLSPMTGVGAVDAATSSPARVEAGDGLALSGQAARDAAPAEQPTSFTQRAATCALALVSLMGAASPALAQTAAPMMSSLSVALPQPSPSSAPSDATAAVAPLPYHRAEVQVVRGDKAVRDVAIRLAAGASKRVSLTSSSFRGIDAARMTDALVDRAAHGVAVDASLRDADPALTARLAAAGVRLRAAGDVAPGTRLEVANGASVVHGAFAFDEADGLSTNLVVTTADAQAESAARPGTWVRELRNDATSHETREALLAHIRAARVSVFIEARALDDAEVVAALRTARDEGVNVNVLLAHTQGDFTPGFNNLRSAVAFTEPNHQVPFRWFDGGALPSITAVFDGQTVLVARDDWTASPTGRVSRDLLVNDRNLATDLKLQMMGDWQEHGAFDLVRPPDIVSVGVAPYVTTTTRADARPSEEGAPPLFPGTRPSRPLATHMFTGSENHFDLTTRSERGQTERYAYAQIEGGRTWRLDLDRGPWHSETTFDASMQVRAGTNPTLAGDLTGGITLGQGISRNMGGGFAVYGRAAAGVQTGWGTRFEDDEPLRAARYEAAAGVQYSDGLNTVYAEPFATRVHAFADAGPSHDRVGVRLGGQRLITERDVVRLELNTSQYSYSTGVHQSAVGGNVEWLHRTGSTWWGPQVGVEQRSGGDTRVTAGLRVSF